MLKSLKLINFRNFSEKNLENFSEKNFIIWENGMWKTNSLEAISLLCNNSILNISLEDMVKFSKDYFFIEVEDLEWKKFSFYYSKIDKKKKYSINGKKVSKKKFVEESYKCTIFSPIFMNMMYLSPSLRRDFLDNILKSSYPNFEELKKSYKKILKSRNSTLKAISENKAKEEELDFWDEKFIEVSEIYYDFRFKITNFLAKQIKNIDKFLSIKTENIVFDYKTKVDKENIKNSLKNYLEKNRKRDIIIWKTAIWPHIDDFEILINDKNISHISSRWEIKSTILYLKLLEWIFIEKKTGKKPILIIDDLLSELDENHKNTLLENISYYQAFISNIKEIENNLCIKI